MYSLSDEQVQLCKEFIRQGYEQKRIRKADRDKYLKIFNAPSSARALGIYLGLQTLSSTPDEDFCKHLPKPLSAYTKPRHALDLLTSVLIYPESLLPKAKKVSRTSKKLYSFQIDESDLEELKVRAEDDGRSVSGVLRMLVKAYLKE